MKSNAFLDSLVASTVQSDREIWSSLKAFVGHSHRRDMNRNFCNNWAFHNLYEYCEMKDNMNPNYRKLIGKA